MPKKQNQDMNERDVKKMLREYGVKSEDELLEKLDETWNKSFCTRCGRELDLTTCAFEDGDPVCVDKCGGYDAYL